MATEWETTEIHPMVIPAEAAEILPGVILAETMAMEHMKRLIRSRERKERKRNCRAVRSR